MKYLITEAQRDFLIEQMHNARNDQQWLNELKPIEPLGETDVFYNDKIMSHNYMPMSVVMELVRAIEAHILGEKYA